MAKLEGVITLAGLPAHWGLMVSLCFFPVARDDAPVPYGGDPPAEAATDCYEIVKRVDLDDQSSQSSYDLPFALERPDGYYYLQVRTLLFRPRADKLLAQAEQFFFARRPLPLTEDIGNITLPVMWPQIPLDELGSYGTIKPQR